MSKTLVYQTNQEFDKCAELLRSIVNAQESRRDSSSPIVHKSNRKEKQKSSTHTRLKQQQQSSKITLTKTSLIKTNHANGIETHERRSSHSPNKTLHPTTEETLLSSSKNHLSPTKSRKHIIRSPSSRQTSHQRLTSPIINPKSRPKPSPPSSFSRHHLENHEPSLRSSSCSDLSSLKSSFMQNEQTRVVLDRFTTYLSRIRTIAKQIRARNPNTFNDSECLYLWNELENSLSSAISYAKTDIQFQLSLVPLRTEILALRKQLQTTNIHLHEYDRTHRYNDQYIYLQKKFDTNQLHCTQLVLHNEELKRKCQLLQDQFDHLQRNHIHLIQRLTQQNIRSVTQRTEWSSTTNRFLLQEEILFLKDKLYYVYDDLATVFNRNHRLESNLHEQKKQFTSIEPQLKNWKQSAQYLLHDLDNRTMEENVRRFLVDIVNGQYHERHFSSPHHRSPTTKPVHSSSLLFQTPQKPTVVPPPPPTTCRTRASPHPATNKLRPKSLFVTPTILNDSKLLSQFHDKRNPTIDITQCSSSTIDDADSTLTSSSSISFYYQQRKRNILYNSLPLLSEPTNIDMTKTRQSNEIHQNESSPELDEISNLTTKIFSSGDDDDIPIRDINISTTTSSSSSPSNSSDAEKLMSM